CSAAQPTLAVEMAEVLLAERDGRFHEARVRVEQQLRGVEAMAALRFERPMHPIAVALALAHAGDIDCPDAGRTSRQRDASLDPIGVEEAELDPVPVLAPQAEG